MTRLTMILDFCLFSGVGCLCYYCLGDKFTPQLILLRKPLIGHKIVEILMKICIYFFFTFTVLGLPMFNVSLKNFLIRIFCGENDPTKFWDYFLSFAPFITMFTLATIFPNIIEVYSIFGMTIWTANAFIYPFLIKLVLLRKRDKSFFIQIFYFLIMIIIMMIALLGTLFNLKII